MYYPEELIEEVRQKNDIVDVISGYIGLQRKGRWNIRKKPDTVRQDVPDFWK